MPDTAIVLISVASGALCLTALGVAIWHTWRLEVHRHRGPGDHPGKPG